MPKILPFNLIPSSTSQKLPITLILFSYHYYLLFPYYSFALMFQVLTSRETWDFSLGMYFVVGNVSNTISSYNGQWMLSSPFSQIASSVCHVTVCHVHWFSNSHWLFLHHAWVPQGVDSKISIFAIYLAS